MPGPTVGEQRRGKSSRFLEPKPTRPQFPSFLLSAKMWGKVDGAEIHTGHPLAHGRKEQRLRKPEVIDKTGS